jgi:hypothetical protein
VKLWPKDDEMKRQWCLDQDITPEHHCCLDMAFAVSRPWLTPHQEPNRIVDWVPAWNEYRIPIAYDGYASTVMRYCPWCGSRLSASRRDEWYHVLYGMGYADPGGEDVIPPEFESDQWWRDRDKSGAPERPGD